jgi:hypothetical protein
MLERFALALVLSLSAPLAAACSGAQDRPTTAMKPIEERRARGVIERALLDSGARPAQGRVVSLVSGGEVVEDLALDGETYGIAYLTEGEQKKLHPNVPSYVIDDDQLRLVRGVDGAITLLLYEQAYHYDAGDTHETTALTAERKLSRDVADFVLHVVKQRKDR